MNGKQNKKWRVVASASNINNQSIQNNVARTLMYCRKTFLDFLDHPIYVTKKHFNQEEGRLAIEG